MAKRSRGHKRRQDAMEHHGKRQKTSHGPSNILEQLTNAKAALDSRKTNNDQVAGEQNRGSEASRVNNRELDRTSSAQLPLDGGDESSSFNGFSSPSSQSVEEETTVTVDRLVALIPAVNQFLSLKDMESLSKIGVYEGDLTLAGDPGVQFFDTSLESKHEDDAQRGMAAVVYFREHIVTDEKARLYIIPKRTVTKSNLFELLRGRCMNWQYSFQSEIMRFLKKGLKRTCNQMGGREFFETTTSVERRKMWGAIFDSNKVVMGKMSLGQIVNYISVGHIFSNRNSLNLKWQSYIKNTFVWAAEDAYLYRFSKNDKALKAEMFSRWISMPLASAFQALNLGDINQTPVKEGGVYSQGKRASAKEVGYGAEHELRFVRCDCSVCVAKVSQAV